MINEIFNIETKEYKSTLNAQDFKNKLERIFKQGALTFKYNLTGSFINDDEFKAVDKWTIGINIKSFENDPAYLKGKIKETNDGTIITLTVRPNSIFLIFGFLCPFVGILTFVNSGFGSTNQDELIVGLGFIISGLISYLIGRYSRNRLRNKFEQYLDLKKMDNQVNKQIK